MTDSEIRARLRACAASAGSQRQLALKIGVSAVYLGDVLRGRRDPGPMILEWLGLERKTTTVKTRKKVRT